MSSKKQRYGKLQYVILEGKDMQFFSYKKHGKFIGTTLRKAIEKWDFDKSPIYSAFFLKQEELKEYILTPMNYEIPIY